MTVHQDLGTLKIDRTRKRRAWPLWPFLGLGGLALALLAGPPLQRHYWGVEVAVVRASKAVSVATGAPGAEELSAAGYVVADRQSVLATKVTGRLVQLNVKEAQKVRKDEVVAEVDHRELDALLAQVHAQIAEARADLERLRKLVTQTEREQEAARAPLAVLDAESAEEQVTLADARRRLERDRKLVTGNAMPSSEVDDRLTEVRASEARLVTLAERRRNVERQAAVVEAQAGVARAAVAVAEARLAESETRIGVLQAQLADSFVRAPYDGVVTEKAAEVGEIVAPISIGGSMARGSIVTLADWASLQAEVDVAEAYISKVRPGQRAALALDAFPGRVYPGRVQRILPRADRSKATVQVRVEFLERGDEVLPEMGVRVKFLPDDAPAGAERGAAPEKLVVPAQALRGGGPDAFVWVVEEGRARRRAVNVGERSAAWVEIAGGLASGEWVVTAGAEALGADGQKVRLAER